MISYVYNLDDAPEDGGTFCPVVVCDAYAERIVGPGNTYWLVLGDDTVDPRVWHTHKFPCSRLDDAIEAQHPDGMVMSEELDCWLAQLHRNATLTTTDG